MKIKSLRKKKGITQAEMAKQLGVKQSTVSMWETGKTMPKTKRMRKLAEVLNCTLDDLLKEEKKDEGERADPDIACQREGEA